MAITFTDNTSSINYTDTGTTPKIDRELTKGDVKALLVHEDGLSVGIDYGSGSEEIFWVLHSDVTAPVAANPIALRDALNVMLQSGTGAGDASAANQVLINANLKRLIGETEARTSIGFAALAASSTMLSATVGRVGFTVMNNTDKAIHMNYGAVAAVVGSADVVVQSNGFYEDPYHSPAEIRVIGDSPASGAIEIVEFTNP